MSKLNKFEDVDVFASLDAIMKQNTGFYQSDFDIDRRLSQKRRQAQVKRIRPSYGFAARPGRIASGSVTFS